MSSISTINSLLSSLFDTKRSSSTDYTKVTAATSGSSITDLLSLSAESVELAKSLFDILSNESKESDGSANSIYDILTSAQNIKLMQNNPELAEMIMTTDFSDETSINAIDLLQLSSEDLLSIIEKYSKMSDSTTADSSSSQIDEIV